MNRYILKTLDLNGKCISAVTLTADELRNYKKSTKYIYEIKLINEVIPIRKESKNDTRN